MRRRFGESAKKRIHQARRAVGRLHQKGFVPRPGRIERVLKATRSSTLAAAMLWFMVVLIVDDLGIFRLPAYMFAVGGALFLFSFGSILVARRLAFRYRELEAESFTAKAGELERAGTLALIGTSILFIGWLIMFTVGVPPWVG